jgi:hypothetical protein
MKKMAVFVNQGSRMNEAIEFVREQCCEGFGGGDALDGLITCER